LEAFAGAGAFELDVGTMPANRSFLSHFGLFGTTRLQRS